MSNARNLANLLGTGTQITTADIADGAFQANKNLIINGAMNVSQRISSSTSLTTSLAYYLDRFKVIKTTSGASATIEQSSTAPANFKNSMLVTITTGAAAAGADLNYISQMLEGQNVSSLSFGTSDAQTVTLSFWVRSSVTGTFSGCLNNGVTTASGRTYPFNYTISSANTWEKKTITIAGDTTGTWAVDNTAGMQVVWDLGSGSGYAGTAGSWATSFYPKATSSVDLVATTGATFYLTGVQLEVGDTATPLEHRSYGDELRRCQRYFQIVESEQAYGLGFWRPHSGVNDFFGVYHYPVEMRATATITHDTSGNFVHQPNIVIQGGSENFYNSSPRVFAARIQPTTTHSVSYALFSITDYFCDAEL